MEELGRCSLAIAHPGHELRIHHCLERIQPRVSVLTDGSGSKGNGRLEDTSRVLGGAGATPGAFFGPFPDSAVYRLLLDGDSMTILTLVDRLVDELVETEADTILSDAWEGFNPSHDLCFLMAASAASRARNRHDRPLRHLVFTLETAPDGPLPGTAETPRDHDIALLSLDDAAWERKLAAARQYGLLRDEVERAFARHDEASFRTEILRAAPSVPALLAKTTEPEYERYGERRVRDGIYEEVIRFRDHVLPLARVLCEEAIDR